MSTFIGNKKIQTVSESGNETVELYQDGSQEILSTLMYKEIVSEIACDATALREKRITPIVSDVLKVLRNWGIKLNELPYMSAVLNESLKQNELEALKELWIKWIPTLRSLDDIDLVSIDRVLKAKGVKELEKAKTDADSTIIPSPYNEK